MEIQIHWYTLNFPGMSSNNRIKAFNFKCPQIFSKLHDTGDTSGGGLGGFFLTKKKHLDDFSPTLDPSKQRTKQSTQVPFLHPHRGHISPMRKKHPPYFEVPNWKGQYVTLPETNISHPRGSWEDVYSFPLGYVIVPWRVKFHSRSIWVSVPQDWLINGAVPLVLFVSRKSRHVFDVHTTHCKILTEPGKPVKNTTYHSCRVLKTDWRKSRLGDPKHEQIPTKNHIYK